MPNLRYLIFGLFVFSAALPQDKVSKIDELLNTCLTNNQFNGTGLVAENGKVIFRKGYGSANFDYNLPNSPETKFRIGSITKQFAAALIMQLVEKNKIKIENKIVDYLTEYRKDTGSKVTIHHLLTHTSGIPSYTGLPNFWSDSTRNPYSVEYVVKTFCSGDLEFEPGTRYLYNNSGYFLLGAIIEKVTGKPFAQVLDENILKPLGMQNTAIEDESLILPDRAAGYVMNVSQRVREPYFHMTNAYAAGAMYSTVDDLYKWDQALYGEKVMSAKSKKLYFAPHFPTGGGNFYGYGWGVSKLGVGISGDTVTVITHSGGINGFNTIIVRQPETKHLVVLFNNTGGAPLWSISSAIFGILNGKPYAPPKISITQPLLATILSDGVDAGIKQYNDWKTTKSEKYNFGEFELNALGYLLLGMNKTKDAIKIFELNIKMFPEAFNPYDSLGEAYMVDGQKDLAIKNYAKSLELNPGNTGAITMLKRIQEMK